jgi:hypothetical protein
LPRDRRRPFLERRRENATGDQSLLLLGVAFKTAGDDPRPRLVAVAHQHLFAIPDELNMGAELRLQIANIYSSQGIDSDMEPAEVTIALPVHH